MAVVVEASTIDCISSTLPRFAATAFSRGLAMSVGAVGTSWSVSGGRIARGSDPGSLTGCSLDASTAEDRSTGDDLSAGAALGAYSARSPSRPGEIAVRRTDSQDPTCVLGSVTSYALMPSRTRVPK